jgi:hypothetical protein
VIGTNSPGDAPRPTDEEASPTKGEWQFLSGPVADPRAGNRFCRYRRSLRRTCVPLAVSGDTTARIALAGMLAILIAAVI